MARRYTTRKLEVYALHARQSNGPVDYRSLFQSIANSELKLRAISTDDRIIAIPSIEMLDDDRVALTAYEGDEDLNPLIYDRENGTERFARINAGEFVAAKTHAVFDLVKREAVIEFNQRGAKASDVATAIESIGGRLPDFPELTVELNAVPGKGFIDAINGFHRVRLASMRIARPNLDWTDHCDHLCELGKQSDGRFIEINITADRGHSLSKESGIIKYIVQVAMQKLSMLKAARVVGRRPDEAADCTVSLAKHVEHQRVKLQMTEEGHVEYGDIITKLSAFLDAREQRGDEQ